MHARPLRTRMRARICIGGFVNGRHVSFHGNRDRQIPYVLGSFFCVRVRDCVYCQLMRIPGWQSPRDRLQAWHISDNHLHLQLLLHHPGSNGTFVAGDGVGF